MILYDRESRCFLEAQAWPDEASLDEFLLHHPEVLSRLLTDDAADNAVVPLAGRSLGGQLRIDADGQARSIDGLFLFDDGEQPPHLVLCEDKKGSSSELRSRAALGQVLQYAACLSEMPIARFQEAIERRLSSEEWADAARATRSRGIEFEADGTEIVERAKIALENRCLILAICADDIPESLALTVRWFSDHLAQLQHSHLNLTTVRIEPVADGSGSGHPLVAAAGLVSVLTDQRDNELVESWNELKRTAELFLTGAVRAGLVELKAAGQMVHASTTFRSEPTPSLGSPQKMAGPHQWLEQVAKEPTRKAYELLSRSFTQDQIRWRPGTRLLVLDLKPDPSTHIDIIRLFADALYFVGDKTLYRIGGEALRDWFRSEIGKRFPVQDAGAKQPVIRGDALQGFVEERGQELVDFVEEVLGHAKDASSETA